jgi:hypothetical protein
MTGWEREKRGKNIKIDKINDISLLGANNAKRLLYMLDNRKCNQLETKERETQNSSGVLWAANLNSDRSGRDCRALTVAWEEQKKFENA